MKRRFAAWLGSAALLGTLLASSAFGGSTGTTNLIMQTGSGALRQHGDWVSNAGELDTYYSYFIEVPPGLSRLQVQIFDADVGAGGGGEAAAGRDRARGAFDTSVAYSLIDPSGAARSVRFTTGNTTSPTGADNAWLALYDGTGNNVLDQFGTAAYNNDDGNNNWATNWIETNDNGSATTGNILITGGQLRIAETDTTPFSAIAREADLLGSPGLGLQVAYLSFSFTTSGNLDATDQVAVDVSSNGGTSYTTLETFSDDGTGTRNYDITGFIANNTRVRFRVVDGFGGNGGTEFFFVDNVQIHDGGAITAGHWELRVDMSGAVTGGDDINALGVRAHDGTAGAGGTELNVYQHSYGAYGVNDEDASRTYTHYPYVSGGCNFDGNNFDWDSAGGVTFSSRTGAFGQTVATLSGNDTWQNSVITGWASDTNATEYGTWEMDLTVAGYPGNANYGDFYIGAYNAANPPPGAQPEANTFRIYLPTDAGGAPAKAYLEQQLRYGGSGGSNGPNPPVAGTASIYTVTVRVVNPEAQAVTFSTPTNIVTANVPGGGTVYGGGAQVSQGTIVSQPAVGGTGNVTWNPGTLAAGTTAILSYRVTITPPSAARLLATATPSSGNGTRARWVDNTSNTTQARATYLAGGLCELAVTPALLTPVVVSDLKSLETPDGVVVEWTTASEIGAAGFDLFRWDGDAWKKVNRRFVTALQEAPQGGRYRVVDPDAPRGVRSTYAVREAFGQGGSRSYGPFGATPEREGAAPRLALQDGQARTARKAAGDATAPTAAGAGRVRLRDVSGALKVGVREAGIVAVSAADIAAGFGLDVATARRAIVSGRLALSRRGRAVASMPWRGGEALLFYGERNESPYSRDSVYWLTPGAGERITFVQVRGTAPAAVSFVDERRSESDRLAATVVATDPESDYWFWDYLSAGDPVNGRRAFALDATGATGAGTARLRVDLHGATATGVENEHHAVVRLNGTPVADLRFTGRASHSAEVELAASLLQDGANSVEVEAMADTGAPWSIFYVDGFDLAYARRFEAPGGALRFRLEDKTSVSLALPEAEALVLDVSDPRRPRQRAIDVEAAPGATVARFTGAAGATYAAATPAGFVAPAWVRPDRPSALRSRRNAAEYVVVAPADLLAAAQRLADLRSAGGLPSRVVDVEDVMDEFAFGEATPHAIRDFLAFAQRRWSSAPRYVLLAGKGSFDYRDNLALGGNLVPPLLLATPDGLFASDAALGDLNGDGLAEVAVGRVPVLTAAELQAYTDKLAAYEADDSPEPRTSLLLADDRDGETDFAAASAVLAGQLPPGYALAQLELDSTPIDMARPALVDHLAAGVDIVNYSGHGALDRLAAEGLLRSSDVAGLDNVKTPVLTALTCIINRFEVPGFSALGEDLVKKAGGGFSAVWAPTGLSDNAEAQRLGRFVYRAIGDEAPVAGRLGDAIRSGIERYRADEGFAWLPSVYVLLGDPALSLKPGRVESSGGGDPTSPTE